MVHNKGNFPKSMFALLGIQFCERYNYYALRGILCIYLTDVLLLQEHTAKIIYHTFAAAVHLLPLLGAILAQNFLGRYKTILLSSLIYAAGSIALGVSAIRLEKVPEEGLVFAALVLIAVGSGGIHSCVEGFAVDQFNMPANHRLLDAYLRLFYFAVRVGTFISLAITPMFSKRFRCLDGITCYPLAFLVPAGAMFLAIFTFRAARRFYRILPAEGHILLKVITCIWAALKKKVTNQEDQTGHWLDVSIEEYGEELVTDCKALVHFFVLFLPFPIFWALYEQQATTWTFQARKLDGNFGEYFSILPEQMQVFNPTLVLVFVPVFEILVYPYFNRFGCLKTPLQRMTIGCFLAVLAFIPPIILQFAIDSFGAQPLPRDVGMLRIFHVFNCETVMQSEYYDIQSNVTMTRMDSHIDYIGLDQQRVQIIFIGDCNPLNKTTVGDLPLYGEYLSCYCYIHAEPCWCEIEPVLRVLSGNCYVRVIANLNRVLEYNFRVRFFDSKGNLYRQLFSDDRTYEEMAPGIYGVQLHYTSVTYRVSFTASGVYTLGIVAEDEKFFVVHVFDVFETSNIHISAMLPQYLIMSLAEVMFVVAGVELAHIEAPHSMKSVVLLFWLFAVGIGQVLVVFIEIINLFGREFYRLILYAIMMLIGSVAFAYVARTYEYINFREDLEEIPYTENTGDDARKRKNKV